MVAAFELLLDAIRENPGRKKIRHVFMSRPVKKSMSVDVEALENDGDDESNDEYEDAHESLGLVSDDLTTILRYRPRAEPPGSRH